MYNDNILGVKSNIYHDCGHIKGRADDAKLYIPYRIHCEWLYIMGMMGDKEWGAVFSIDSSRTVNGYKIPKQEVTSASVTFKEELGHKGMIHSHHGLGLKDFSSQDDRQARNLYDISLIIFNGGYTGCEKVSLPCGGSGYRSLSLYITDVPEVLSNAIQEKIKIELPVPTYSPYELALMGDWRGGDFIKYEKEAVLSEQDDNFYTETYGVCSLCESPLHEGFHYCSVCGQPASLSNVDAY